MNNFYVYHLIDPLTNLPFYVGKGKGNRMSHHMRDVNNGKMPHNNRHLFYKIKKINRLSKKVICQKIFENLNECDAFQKEKEEILKFGRKINKTGILCNITEGGDGISGIKISKKTKKKLSESLKKYYSINPSKNIGKKHSNKTKEKLRKLGFLRKNSRITRQKISNSLMGHKHSKETLIKLSNSHIGISNKFKGIPRTQKIRDKISTSNNFRKKEIIQCDINNKFIKKWKGIGKAAQQCNLYKSGIQKCLKNKVLTCGGYKWKYV
jgi:hypothetical protein